MSEEKKELKLTEVSYVLEFARQMNVWNNNISNPMIANQGMKNTYFKPKSFDMETIRQMLEAPQYNENNLREFSQYCYNTQMPFRKLVDYYASILEFDYTILPTNVSSKQMKTENFTKSYYKALEYLEKLNPKKAFRELMTTIMKEDVAYIYYRENSDYIKLQKLPSDYCLIDQEGPLGYAYSFDMSYFTTDGNNINNFAPEFKRYLSNVNNMRLNDANLYSDIRLELRKGRYSYWQQLPAGKAWVFKFNFDNAVVNPPLSSLFLMTAEIESYRQLQRNKDMIEAYKLIMGVIPRDKNSNVGNKKDAIAIQPETAVAFSQHVKSALPDGIDFKAVPFEQLEMFEFAKSGEDLLGQAISNLYSTSGTSSYLFAGGDKTNVSIIKATQQTDVAFVKHMYKQFETMVNYYLAKLNTKFTFKVKFEGNIWDEEQRQEIAMKVSQSAMPLPQKIAASMHMSPLEFDRQLEMNHALNLADKFMVIPTSYTQSASSSETGRPTSSTNKIGDAGTKTQDTGQNNGKEAI